MGIQVGALGPEAIVDSIVRLSGELLREGLPSDGFPPTLFHFTDAAGLVGILTDRCFRASRARCMNDAGEVSYAVRLAKEILEEGSDRARSDMRQAASRYLDPQNIESHIRLEIDPFVVSFCSSGSESSQWLHYGRGGDGYALGFDADGLRPAADLIKVIYDRDQQRSTLTRIIDAIEERAMTLIRKLPSEDAEGGVEAAAQLLAITIWGKAPWMKDPAFKSENEWRLVLLERRGQMIQPQKNGLKPFYRVSGNKIVPYYELSDLRGGKRKISLKSITVGSKVDFNLARSSITHLLSNLGFDESTPIGRSSVPLQ